MRSTAVVKYQRAYDLCLCWPWHKMFLCICLLDWITIVHYHFFILIYASAAAKHRVNTDLTLWSVCHFCYLVVSMFSVELARAARVWRSHNWIYQSHFYYNYNLPAVLNDSNSSQGFSNFRCCCGLQELWVVLFGDNKVMLLLSAHYSDIAPDD